MLAGQAIWTYAYACPSAGGDTDLRLCMFELQKGFGGDMDLRAFNVSALVVIWTYVYACLSAGGDLDLRSSIS